MAEHTMSSGGKDDAFFRISRKASRFVEKRKRGKGDMTCPRDRTSTFSEEGVELTPRGVNGKAIPNVSRERGGERATHVLVLEGGGEEKKGVENFCGLTLPSRMPAGRYVHRGKGRERRREMLDAPGRDHTRVKRGQGRDWSELQTRDLLGRNLLSLHEEEKGGGLCA